VVGAVVAVDDGDAGSGTVGAGSVCASPWAATTGAPTSTDNATAQVMRGRRSEDRDRAAGVVLCWPINARADRPTLEPPPAPQAHDTGSGPRCNPGLRTPGRRRRRRARAAVQQHHHGGAQQHQHARQRHRLAVAGPPGARHEPFDGDGDGRPARPGQEHRRPELAEAGDHRQGGPPPPARARTSGSSTRHHRCDADAPSSAAVSSSDAGTARSPGRTARTTRGSATIAWAIGTIHHEPRRSTGGRPNASRSPSPIVVEEMPSGSSRLRSATPPGRRAMTRTAGSASAIAIATATSAVATDTTTASSGETWSPVPLVTDPIRRQCERPWPSTIRSDRSTSARIGSSDTTDTTDAVAATRPHSPPRGRCRAGRPDRGGRWRRRVIMPWTPRVAITATSCSRHSTPAPDRSN
jgi:hypothetical protein